MINNHGKGLVVGKVLLPSLNSRFPFQCESFIELRITGPIISFEKENGFQLRNADHFENGEKLYLRLSDPIGINLTGEIGHEILYSDKSNENKSDITHLFIYDENSITTGRILINDLSNENLYFQVKAWDNANNPSEKEIKLFIHKIWTHQKIKVP